MSTWRLKWRPAAIAALRAMPWRQAARVDAAVMHFAATGKGWVEGVQGDPRGLRLHAPPYVAILQAEPEETRLQVLAIYRRG